MTFALPDGFARTLATAVVFCSFLASVAEAQPGVWGAIGAHVCNKGNVEVSIASAIRDDGMTADRPHTVAGWTKVAPNACQRFYSGYGYRFYLGVAYTDANGVFGTADMEFKGEFQGDGSFISARLRESATQSSSRDFCVSNQGFKHHSPPTTTGCPSGWAPMRFGLFFNGSANSGRLTFTVYPNASVRTSGVFGSASTSNRTETQTLAPETQIDAIVRSTACWVSRGFRSSVGRMSSSVTGLADSRALKIEADEVFAGEKSRVLYDFVIKDLDLAQVEISSPDHDGTCWAIHLKCREGQCVSRSSSTGSPTRSQRLMLLVNDVGSGRRFVTALQALKRVSFPVQINVR